MLGTGEYKSITYSFEQEVFPWIKYSGMRCEIIYSATGGGAAGGRGEVGDDFRVQVKKTSDHEIEGEKLKLTEWYLR